MSLALHAYRQITGLLEGLAPRLLAARVRAGKEDPERVGERLGLAGRPRPPGPLVWLHGVSVGETLSLLPLVARLRADRPDLTLLVTSGTVTSAQLLAERLPAGVLHQFIPVDGPRAVAAFLDHWRPALGVLVESELWPNLILAARDRDIPVALVSARVTEATHRGWRRLAGAARILLGGLALVLPQDAESADRLADLGARIDGEANLKLAGEPLPYDRAAFARLSEAIGDRAVIVAASTHPHEEAFLLRALSTVPQPFCLVLLPRHPDRGAEIAGLLEREGRAHAVRSRGEPLDGGVHVYVADTLGEMGLFLRLADVVIMGGSFAPVLGRPAVGGHNPLEPARLGKPTLSGPDASNWTAVTALLTARGALGVVRSAIELAETVEALLDDPAEARAMGERARRTAADAGAGLDRLVQALTPLLPPAGGGERA
jgi:3-deoxy-D-manno-octulosonic-acid transferase